MLTYRGDHFTSLVSEITMLCTLCFYTGLYVNCISLKLGKVKNFCPASRQMGKGRELFLCLLFFSCLPLKTILCQSGMFWGGMFWGGMPCYPSESKAG